mmetsp:Transcript_57177/g.131256  ORF Transcript_57177/g.131256 Transcript_57177/m.131256 type:complete len:213 (-) Transcript_57177:163-801(-)
MRGLLSVAPAGLDMDLEGPSRRLRKQLVHAACIGGHREKSGHPPRAHREGVADAADESEHEHHQTAHRHRGARQRCARHVGPAVGQPTDQVVSQHDPPTAAEGELLQAAVVLAHGRSQRWRRRRREPREVEVEGGRMPVGRWRPREGAVGREALASVRALPDAASLKSAASLLRVIDPPLPLVAEHLVRLLQPLKPLGSCPGVTHDLIRMTL